MYNPNARKNFMPQKIAQNMLTPVFIDEFASEYIKDRIERFSSECRKTKTKVITPANHKEHKQYSEPIKTGSNYM